MNNKACLNPLQCYIIPVLQNQSIFQQPQLSCYTIVNFLPPVNSTANVSVLPVYSPIAYKGQISNTSIQSSNDKAKSKRKATCQENMGTKGAKNIKHSRMKIEIPKSISATEIAAYNKLNQQMVTCYLCCRNIKKIKAFEYKSAYFVCMECAAYRSISKNYLKDWSYEGTIECHGCKNKRFLNSFICYKEASKVYYQSPFCIYCRNIHDLYNLKKKSNH